MIILLSKKLRKLLFINYFWDLNPDYFSSKSEIFKQKKNLSKKKLFKL